MRWPLCEVPSGHNQPQPCSSSHCRGNSFPCFLWLLHHIFIQHEKRWRPFFSQVLITGAWWVGAVDIAWWRSSEALSEHRDVTHCTPCPSPSQPQGSPSISPPHDGRWRGPCQPFTRTALQQVSGVKWLYETCLVPYPVIMIKSGKVKFVLSSTELKKKYTNKQKNNQQPITKLKLLLWLFFFHFV